MLLKLLLVTLDALLAHLFIQLLASHAHLDTVLIAIEFASLAHIHALHALLMPHLLAFLAMVALQLAETHVLPALETV